MSGRDNNYVKVHLRLSYHPAVVAGGFCVDLVFTLLLRVAREMSDDGAFPAECASVDYLRRVFRIDGDIPDAFLESGLAAVQSGDRPLVIFDGDRGFIRGWGDDYGAIKRKAPKADDESETRGLSSTERSRRRRERIAAQRDATGCNGATDATPLPLHGPLQPLHATEVQRDATDDATPQSRAVGGDAPMQRHATACNGIEENRREEKEQQDARAHASVPARVDAAPSVPVEAAPSPPSASPDDFDPMRPYIDAWTEGYGEAPDAQLVAALKRWRRERRPAEMVRFAASRTREAGRCDPLAAMRYAQGVMRSARPDEWAPEALPPSSPQWTGPRTGLPTDVTPPEPHRVKLPDMSGPRATSVGLAQLLELQNALSVPRFTPSDTPVWGDA